MVSSYTRLNIRKKLFSEIVAKPWNGEKKKKKASFFLKQEKLFRKQRAS